MTDRVKISCTFVNSGVSETVVSPELHLYVCNGYSKVVFPPNIVLIKETSTG